MCPGGVSHGKRHPIDSIRDHKPITGDHDENAVVVMDANGLPVKDSGIQISTLVTGLSYVDEWDASGGTYPTPTKVGNFWTISVAGTLGGIPYAVHDWLVYVKASPVTWKKIDNTDLVTSVEGRTGAVALKDSDIFMDGKQLIMSTISWAKNYAITPPLTPVENDVWMVGITAQGLWTGHDGKFAIWRSGIWQFFSQPSKGCIVYSKDTDRIWRGNGLTSWIPIDQMINSAELLNLLATFNAQIIDSELWAKKVAESGGATPPITPILNAYYLVGNGATGVWAGHGGQVAKWSGIWTFIIPLVTDVWVTKAENNMYFSSGTSWILLWTKISYNNLQNLPTHAGLTLLNWASAGHTIDTDINMAGFEAIMTSYTRPRNIVNAPPAHVDGEVWIVGTTPSGAFIGHANQLARSMTGAWTFVTPKKGWLASLTDTSGAQIFKWDGSQWKLFEYGLQHEELTNKEWSNAGHTIDVDIDMDNHNLKNIYDMEENAMVFGSTDKGLANHYIYDYYIGRTIPGAGYDYVEMGSFAGTRHNLIISVSNPTDGHMDTFILATFNNMTGGAWHIAQPIAGKSALYLLLVKVDTSTVELRLMRNEVSIATPAQTWTHIFSYDGGVFTEASGTGTQSPIPNIFIQQTSNVQQFIMDITAQSFNGDVVSGIVGETIGYGDLCYLKQADKRWYKASNAAVSTSEGHIALAVGVASVGGSLTLLLKGYMRKDTGWAWVVDDTKRSLYIGATAGSMVQDKPAFPAMQRNIGFAVSANTIWFEADEYGETSTGIPDASESVKGITELATQAEADVGTDDARIMTPLKSSLQPEFVQGGEIVGPVTSTSGTFALAGTVTKTTTAGNYKLNICAELLGSGMSGPGFLENSCVVEVRVDGVAVLTMVELTQLYAVHSGIAIITLTAASHSITWYIRRLNSGTVGIQNMRACLSKVVVS
jgi:hypothetical protein